MRRLKQIAGLMACIIFFALFFSGTQTLSGNTVADITLECRYILNAVNSFEMWSEAEFLAWINRGIEDIASQTYCLQAREEITLVNDQLEYDITLNYVHIVAAYHVNNAGTAKGLTLSSPANMGIDTYSSTVPSFYFDFDEKLSVFPPLASVNNDKVWLYLAQKPAALTLSTDAIPIPAVWESALIKYVAGIGWFKDRQNSKGAQSMTAYQQEIDKLKKLLKLGTEVAK